MVGYVVRKFKHKTDNIREDLIQEGLMGLSHAIRYFDMEKGENFPTYARTTIWGRIKRYEEQKERQVPMKWTEKRKKFYYFLLEKKKETPSNDISGNWVVEFLEQNPDFPDEDIRHILLFMRGNHVSLETTIGDNGETTFSDFIPDDRVDIERGFIYKSDLEKMHDWAVEAVRKAEKPAHYEVVITDRIFSESPRTSQDIANQFNLTRKESTHLAETKIKEMIRKHFRRYNVDYVNSHW